MPKFGLCRPHCWTPREAEGRLFFVLVVVLVLVLEIRAAASPAFRPRRFHQGPCRIGFGKYLFCGAASPVEDEDDDENEDDLAAAVSP